MNTNIATIANDFAERVARAQYSVEYYALYTRLDEAGKYPDNYVGHIGGGFHPASFAEVSNTSVDNCAGLHSYQGFDFYEEAARILVKFTRKAYDPGMPVEDFFHGLRVRLSRIVRTWEGWLRDLLEERAFYEMLEEIAYRLEYDEANRLLEVAWLLRHAYIGKEWQEAILSLLSV